MWVYQKTLLYPVTVRRENPQLAKAILMEFGGLLTTPVRYLTQRYCMPIQEAKAVLTEIGTEELGHGEMIACMVYHLMGERNQAFPFPAQIDLGATPSFCGANPVTLMYENMAAEKRAQSTYERLMDLSDDPGVTDGLRFLWQREIVHFQRFGETLNLLHDHYGTKMVFHTRSVD